MAKKKKTEKKVSIELTPTPDSINIGQKKVGGAILDKIMQDYRQYHKEWSRDRYG